MDQSSPDFCLQTWQRMWLITPRFLCLSISYPFPRYSRSKSEVVRNRAKFWTFLASHILGGRLAPNICTHIIMSALRNLTWKSFVRLLLLGPKVITGNTLNFKPIFECSLLKIVGVTPVPAGVCASKPWPFSSACKNLSRRTP